jgi:hypothetical protein
LGLQLASVVLGNLATESQRNLVRLSNGSIGVEQTLAELVQCRAEAKDDVVAELDLREEQPVPTARFLSLSCGLRRELSARATFGRKPRGLEGRASRRVPAGDRAHCISRKHCRTA